MSHSQRAIALQGLGFSPRLLALQGFEVLGAITPMRDEGIASGGPGVQISRSEWERMHASALTDSVPRPAPRVRSARQQRNLLFVMRSLK